MHPYGYRRLAWGTRYIELGIAERQSQYELFKEFRDFLISTGLMDFFGFPRTKAYVQNYAKVIQDEEVFRIKESKFPTIVKWTRETDPKAATFSDNAILLGMMTALIDDEGQPHLYNAGVFKADHGFQWTDKLKNLFDVFVQKNKNVEL